MKIAIGSDHAALSKKAALAAQLVSWGHEVTDFGTFTDGSVDYPRYAALVARSSPE